MNLTGKSSCLFTIRGKRQRAVQQSSVLTRTSKPKTRRVKGQSRSLSQPKKNTGIKCQEETGVAPMGCKAIFTHVQPKFNQCKNVFLTLFHFLNLLNFLFLSPGRSSAVSPVSEKCFFKLAVTAAGNN